MERVSVFDHDLSMPNEASLKPQLSHTATSKRYWMLLTRGIWIALIAHAIFIVLFYVIGARILAVVNVGSVAVYVLCVGLLRQKRNRAVLILAWAEVITHAALAVGSLGWDSGFHYYLLLFIPLIFVSTTRKPGSKLTLAVLLGLIYMGMDVVMRFVPPLNVVDPLALAVLRYLNIAVCFVVLGYLAYFYSRTVGKVEQRLRVMAATDSLTGLYNRRHIIGIAEYEKTRRRRSHRPLSFIIADIDDFKIVNDRYGHEAGDQALVLVSQRMRGVLREQDSVARWGGEEFLVLLPDTELRTAVAVAERIRKTIALSPVVQGENELAVTMTLGVDECREDEGVDACIARADNALYHGKKSGKNCVRMIKDLNGE